MNQAMQSEPDERGDRPSRKGGIFRTVLLWSILPAWTVLCGSTAILAGWLRYRALFRLSIGMWSRGILFLSGIRLAVTRAPELQNVPCVFVANHQSALDIPAFTCAILSTHDIRFMAKESLFKIPFLGWGISGNGFIPIRRENPRHAADTINKIVAQNGPQASYVIFPEGTRSPDGRLLEFRRGSIAMALRLQRPLVPVSIIDACLASPKNSWLVHPGTIRIVFHAPIPLAEGAAEDRAVRDEMTARVQQTVNDALPAEQRGGPAV